MALLARKSRLNISGTRLPRSDAAWTAASAAASADLVTSVCTGSMNLGAVGLLDGRDATTNRFYSGIVEKPGGVPPAAVSRGRRRDDVGRGLRRHRHGPAPHRSGHRRGHGQRVQLAIDYDPQPPYGGIDYADTAGAAGHARRRQPAAAIRRLVGSGLSTLPVQVLSTWVPQPGLPITSTAVRSAFRQSRDSACNHRGVREPRFGKRHSGQRLESWARKE